MRMSGKKIILGGKHLGVTLITPSYQARLEMTWPVYEGFRIAHGASRNLTFTHISYC